MVFGDGAGCGWLLRAPDLDEIASEIRDDRRKRKDTAVVIPSYKNPSLLKKHLSKLSEQTFKDFDAIVVLGGDDEALLERYEFGILYLRRKLDFGSAGAFYAGEKRAFEDGYRTIVLADDDCLPQGPDLLGNLVAKAQEKKVAKAQRMDVPRKPRMAVLPQYGAITRDVFERVGFSFLPFYTGGEDVELEIRMNRAGLNTDNFIEDRHCHPMMPTFLLWPRYKLYHYFRNASFIAIISGWPAHLGLAMLCQLLLGSMFIAIGRPDAGICILRALWGVTWGVFFQDKGIGGRGAIAIEDGAMEDGVVPVASKVPEYVEIDIPCGYMMPILWKMPKGTLLDASIAVAKDLAGQAAAIGGNLGKKIVYKDFENDLELFALLFSQSAWAVHEGRAYSITKGRSVAGIVLGIFFFAAALPLSLILAPLLSLTAMIVHKAQGIRTEGYGL
ncbi:MAG: glycosyltransferase [Candidatus Micrarchaeota archaeon]